MGYWENELKQLIGGKITKVLSSTWEEQPNEPLVGLELTMPNRTKKGIWFLNDEEGNSPGRFEIYDCMEKRE